MSQQVLIEIEMPAALSQFKLPSGVNKRLQDLLDRQDNGELLTDNERREAEGLVDLAEFLSLLRLRSNRVSSEVQSPTPNVSSPASDIWHLTSDI